MESSDGRHSKKITIGFVTTQLASGNGWARYSRSLIESVSDYYDVRVLTQKGLDNETKVKGALDILPDANFNPLSQIKVAAYIIRHFREVDIIHSLVEPYAPAVALAGHILGIPTTMTLHGTYSVPPSNFSLKKLMMMYMYHRMKIVTTGSLYTEKKVRESIALKKCFFIPNGVNMEKFHIIPGIEKEDLIMTVGMLKARKGVDTTIEALALLKDEFPLLRYQVIGDDQRDAFSDMLKRRVQELGLSERVQFVSGISDEDLLTLYNKAKVFILAARDTNEGSFEGFPMVFYEANACGTPVITTKGFGSEYAIHDDENGFVVSQDSPEEVAEKIRLLMKDRLHYDEMSKKSVIAATNHTWDKVAVLLDEYYREILR